MAKVLIVNDSRLYRFSVRRLMKEWGHEMIVAKNGQQAIVVAREQLPELILMDIIMPGMSGFEAKRILASDELTSHIPVIFVSTQDEETDKAWRLRQGAHAYVTKPIEPEALQAAIANAMAT